MGHSLFDYCVVTVNLQAIFCYFDFHKYMHCYQVLGIPKGILVNSQLIFHYFVNAELLFFFRVVLNVSNGFSKCIKFKQTIVEKIISNFKCPVSVG